jgi:hypothetical protein
MNIAIVNFNKVIQLSTLKGAAENYCTMQVNHNMVIKIFWLWLAIFLSHLSTYIILYSNSYYLNLNL